jgi:hypothetical protein
VCRSTEFAVSHDEVEQEFHRRLQQQLQQRKAEQQQQQQQQPAGNTRSSRYSCSLAPIPSCSDLSCSAQQFSSGDCATNKRRNKSNKVSDDLEAVRLLLLAERHYVPAVELFRKHWGALLLQCGYEACELNGRLFAVCSLILNCAYISSGCHRVARCTEHLARTGVDIQLGIQQTLPRPLHCTAEPTQPFNQSIPRLFLSLRRDWCQFVLVLLSFHAGIGAALQLGINWLPGYFMRQAGLPQHLALWMVLSCIALFAAAVAAAGAASDRGVGRLRASMVVCGIAGKCAVGVCASWIVDSAAAHDSVWCRGSALLLDLLTPYDHRSYI